MAKPNIYLILDNIRSRENVGSIFRTADGAGVTKIYLCGITPVPKLENKGLYLYHDRIINTISKNGKFSDKISKTALGAEKWVPWEYRKQTWKCLLELKNQSISRRTKIKVIGLERFDKLTASKLKIQQKNIFKYKPPKNKKIALVVGNEVRGLSPKILKYCDRIVHIPMYGKKESLNVSVATGIALYQLINRKW